MLWRASWIVQFTTLIGLICGHFVLDAFPKLRTHNFDSREYIRPEAENFGNLLKTAYNVLPPCMNMRNNNMASRFLKDLYGKQSNCAQSKKQTDKTNNINEYIKSDSDNYNNVNMNELSDLNDFKGNLDVENMVYKNDAVYLNETSTENRNDIVYEIPAVKQLRHEMPTHKIAHATLLASLPISYYASFLKELISEPERQQQKRSHSAPVIGCECKVKNDLMDLGPHHFPRYLLNAICLNEHTSYEHPQKCWLGSMCKPLEYKVKVLTFRTVVDHHASDPALAWLPEDLRQVWKFKTVTVSAGCFCSY